MIIREIQAKSILSPSKVHQYSINPYVGCQHNCSYCYARYMKKYTDHKEPWGKFVDIKINAADLLQKEIERMKSGRACKKPGHVWISGVCDPYQPQEAVYKITRRCLEILVKNNWPVSVQTRSPLVLRDIDVLTQGKYLEAGLSITTADDNIRKLFEADAPAISERVRALDELHKAGIHTFAMIAPALPGAEGLAEILAGKVDYVLVDRMNYHHADWIYRKYKLEGKMTDEFFRRTGQQISSWCKKYGIDCRVLY
jgi:DNA repair photolyase